MKMYMERDDETWENVSLDRLSFQMQFTSSYRKGFHALWEDNGCLWRWQTPHLIEQFLKCLCKIQQRALYLGFIPRREFRFTRMWKLQLWCSELWRRVDSYVVSRVNQGRKQQNQATSWAQLAACFCWFQLCLLFDPEDGGDIRLRYVGLFQNYTTSQPKTPHHHIHSCKDFKSNKIKH
jgi:hypothetical protein